MKTKPFNISAVKAGEKPVTLGGTEAKFVARELGLKQPLVFRIMDSICCYNEDGTFNSDGTSSVMDLFLVNDDDRVIQNAKVCRDNLNAFINTSYVFGEDGNHTLVSAHHALCEMIDMAEGK